MNNAVWIGRIHRSLWATVEKHELVTVYHSIDRNLRFAFLVSGCQARILDAIDCENFTQLVFRLLNPGILQQRIC